MPDYNPDDDGADALTAFVAAQQPALAQSVQSHTGDMLATALAAALLDASTGTHPTQPLTDAVNALYDQWLGEGGDGSDYASALAGDWTALGWNHGEWDAATQVEASTSITAGTSGDGGSGVQRTWTAVGDAHTRPEHAAADGQTVGLHDPFDVGGESLMYPCDPTGSLGNTINCRCSISYTINGVGIGDDEGDDSAAE